MKGKTENLDEWWYLDEDAVVKGPVSTAVFASLFADGQVDGLTRVTSNCNDDVDLWAPLSENDTLRDAALAAGNDKEENAIASGQDAKEFTRLVGEEFSHKPSHEPSHARETALEEDALSAQNSIAAVQPDLEKAMAKERKKQSRKRAREAARLRNKVNTSIYVTGVPADATEKELAIFFSKCGIIMPNPETGVPRIKLYANDEGELKGDALVTYALAPSVENALELLDGTSLRAGGPPLQIQAASFEHKKAKPNDKATNGAPVSSEQKNVDEEAESKHRRVFKSRDLVNEALSWAEDGQETGHAPRIVVLKNVFDRKTADYDIIREDMQEGCERCGEVEKITIFEQTPEGVVAVKFATTEACIKCIEIMNGRWYDGRRLTAAFYDGYTDFRHKETEEERREREKKWQEWLEKDQESKEDLTTK